VVSGHGWERPEIGGIYVKPEHRRKGVASALLAEAQKHEAHKIQHSRNLTYDGDQFARHFEPDMEERYTFEPDLVMSLSCAETTEIVDLANPSLRRTRYVTGQLLDGKDPATLLHHRGISREVAEAVAALAGKGTAVRPNARRRGMPLSLGMRIERDREALYRGAYLLKAAERVQASVDAGKSLREALNVESPYYVAHEKARRGRLDAVTEAHRVAMRLGTVVQTPEGTTRTLLGWYLDPLLKNDPECVAANGHNYYAEEGTVIGYPGAVHLNCGCKSGPPIEGAGMVNDAVRGVVTLGLVSKKPAYPLSRKRKTA
jgi:GNAT superfamily N-acetyltransferase